MRRAEADTIQFMKEKGLCGTQSIAAFLSACDSATTSDEDNTLGAGVSGSHSAGTLSLGNISSRPVLLRSVGKPLWEFTDPRHFVKALLAIVAGIAALDCHGILHRDINAGNVLLSLDPREGYEAFLTDFEFASADELRTIKVVVDDNHPVDVAQMPNEQPVPEKAINTCTTWIIERGQEMTDAMQFMAIDVLQNIIAYAETQERQRRGIHTALADQIQRGVKHDLESLVWVAEYAVYRRAFEATKGSDELLFRQVTEAMKMEFGQVTAEKILEQRESTAASFGKVRQQDVVYRVVDKALYGIMRALLDEVQVQNPAHLSPKDIQYQTRINKLRQQDKILADAEKPMTCKRMEEVLNVCLDVYCSE